MYRLSILPDNHGHHVLQLYAGFYQLAREVEIQFRYFKRVTEQMRVYHDTSSLWAELEDLARQKKVKICFDMFDGGQIASLDGLQKCDIYFKRSYSQKVLDHLDPSLRSKVKPLGLNYDVIGDMDKHLLTRLYRERQIKKAQNIRIKDAEKKLYWELILSTYAKDMLPNAFKRKLLIKTSEFEAKPQESLSGKILFQCRVWSPESTPRVANIKPLNDRRAEIVRALRNHFKQQFVGGLVASRYAIENYPDCITDQPTDRPSFLALMKKVEIAILTEGLHRSIPWKCAEYLASSKCMVSEPLAYELPEPLEPGVNYLPFTHVEECIKACETLLKNPNQARAMQQANFEYYQRHVKPARLIANCFKVVLDDGSPTTKLSHEWDEPSLTR